jgi:HK97 gp10 family phage protein
VALSTSTRLRQAFAGKGFVIEGLDVVVDDLTTASVTAGLRASRVVRSTAEAIAETMREMVPVQSGTLQRSIVATGPDDTPLSTAILEAEIGPSKRRGGWYGHLVERGTTRTSPRPFVEPAGDLHSALFEVRMQQVAGDI